MCGGSFLTQLLDIFTNHYDPTVSVDSFFLQSFTLKICDTLVPFLNKYGILGVYDRLNRAFGPVYEYQPDDCFYDCMCDNMSSKGSSSDDITLDPPYSTLPNLGPGYRSESLVRDNESMVF